jgi:HSP20 family protein
VIAPKAFVTQAEPNHFEQERFIMNDKTAATAVANPGAASTAGNTPFIVPRVDVVEDRSGITLLADLPGVKKDGLDIKVEGPSLTLEGAIQLDTPQGLDASFAEVRAARYRRAFTLSSELDSSAIDAQLKDGVLRLRIPKVAEAQPRRIEVRAG